MPNTLVAPAAPAALAATPVAPSKPSAAPAAPSTPAAPPKAPAPPVAAIPELTDEGRDYDAAFEAREPKKPDATKPDAAPKPGAALPKPDAQANNDKKLQSNPELRARLEVVKEEMEAANKRIAEYEARIKDAEKHGESVKVLSAQLEAKEKVLNDLQGQLRALKQETSPEFQAKWDKPFNDAMRYAAHDIVGLTVTDADTQTERPATWEDFQALYALPKAKGILKAEEMFGRARSIVTDHLKELQRHDYNRVEALKAEKAGWQTKLQEDAAKETQGKIKQEEFVKKFNEDKAKAFKAFEEANPELYGEIPGDDEGNKLRLEGQQMLAKQPQTPDEMIAYQTEVYHNASNFKREHHLRTKAEAALAEANATIEAMKNSAPGKTRRDSTPSKTTEESWEEEARRTVGSV